MSTSLTTPTKALWTWSVPSTGGEPVATAYPTTNGPTKSGVTPQDLRNYLQIPIQQWTNPPVPIPDSVIQQWIRWAEDEIETDTNVRLCQTWIAAPAAKSAAEVSALSLSIAGQYQQLGIDYDYSEAAYDFFFERWRDEGWGYQRMRWRPVQSVELSGPNLGAYDIGNFTGAKKVAFIYPLLNEYFTMPLTWVVEDQKRGMLRFVPATSVQMLPLFALQLAFMGFAQSVPGGLWFQYTAGLTANDYNSSWSYMKQLVLARAAMTALGVMQTSISLGAIETNTQADGLSFKIRYSEKGPFAYAIAAQKEMDKELTRRAKMMGGGINFGYL